MKVKKIEWVAPDTYRIIADNKQGLIIITENKDEILSTQYQQRITDFYPERSLLQAFSGREYKIKILVKPEYDLVSDIVKNFYLLRSGKTVFIINTASGFKKRMPDTVTEVYLEWNDTLSCLINGKWGLYSLTGTEIISPQYDEIEWKEPYYRICLDHKTGYCTKEGKEIFPPIYPFAEPFAGNSFRVRNINNKWGIISKEGKIIVNVIYDEVAPVGRNLFKVRSENKWGAVCRSGEMVADFLYDDITEGNDKAVFVKMNDQWGLLKKEDWKIIPPRYDSIKPIPGYRYAYLKNGKWGAIDVDGNELLPAKYDDITFSYDDKFNVIFESQSGTVHLSDLSFVRDKPKSQRFIKGNTSRRLSSHPIPKNKRDDYTKYDFSDN